MRVRRFMLLRSAAFFAGLAGFAAAGLAALAWAALTRSAARPRGRGLARRAAAAGLRFADALYPGIVAVSPFGSHYCRVGKVSCPRRVAPGAAFAVEVMLENIGEDPWQGRGGSHPVRLGTWNPPDHPSAFHDARTWVQDNRPAELSGDVPPLGTATFRMTFLAPAAPGVHAEELAPVAEHLRWFPATPIRIEVEVGE
jgi:hypothetical protein